jgi:hypothetical protein
MPPDGIKKGAFHAPSIKTNRKPVSLTKREHSFASLEKMI